MNVHKMRRAAQALTEGIPVGLGTDSSCPYVTQYDMWRELAYFFMALPAQPLRAWDKGGVRALLAVSLRLYERAITRRPSPRRGARMKTRRRCARWCARAHYGKVPT